MTKTVNRDSGQALPPPGLSVAAAQTSMPKLFTVEEIAEIFRVKKFRVYEWARTGAVPGAVRLGRQLRFNATQVLAFIDQGGQALPGGWRNTV